MPRNCSRLDARGDAPGWRSSAAILAISAWPVRLPIGESEPILQHSAIKIIQATEQLRSQHLSCRSCPHWRAARTISSMIVVKGGQGPWPLVADQPGGPFLTLAQGLSQLRGGRQPAECLGQFCPSRTPSRPILLGRLIGRFIAPTARRRRTDIGANPVQREVVKRISRGVVKAHHCDRERNATPLETDRVRGTAWRGASSRTTKETSGRVGRDEPPPRPVALLLDQQQLCGLACGTSLPLSLRLSGEHPGLHLPRKVSLLLPAEDSFGIMIDSDFATSPLACQTTPASMHIGNLWMVRLEV